MNPKSSKFWRVGELAKASGVSADTLRHYERKGVLCSQRSGNGYRQYPEDALERVRMIRQALAVGFTLDELSAVFKVFDRGGAPCHQVRSLAANKLAEIENHLLEVTALRDDLQAALKDWDARLSKVASGERAGLLKTLAARKSVTSSSTSLLLRKPKRKKKERAMTNRYFMAISTMMLLVSFSVSGQHADKHMGFDLSKTTHHFILSNNGGSIQVEANDAKDTESRDQIRGHLRHIRTMFSEGNFEVPMLVHEKTVPGTKVMGQLKDQISYEFKETEKGAAIQISTANNEALQAIHEFLRFQIKEHKTGDPLEVKE